MELRPTDVRLPVRQIRDANLAWVRSDAEAKDDDLLKSLREEGMKLPILLTNELVIADGARRFLRAVHLGWRDVPVIVTTEWDVVYDYFQDVREMAAAGEPYEPMTWAEIVDLVAGPLDLLYRRRRLERGRASRAEAAARRAAGQPRSRAKSEVDYVGEAADVLGWRRSDLRSVREMFWALQVIKEQEDAQRKAAYLEGGAEAADAIPRRAELLRDEVTRLENDGGLEGGLYSLLKKLRWIAAGKDPAIVKTGRAKRKVGEPTFTERRAKAAADPQATGREMDAQTLARLTNVLTGLGVEADEYTHLRPQVRIDEARTSAKNIRTAVNQINRLVRVIKAYADYLEESS